MPNEAPTTLRAWVAAQVVRRPAVFAAGAVMAGVALHAAVPVAPVYFLLWVVAAVLAAWMWRDRPALASAWLAAGLFAAGLAVAQVERYRFPGHHVAHFARDEPRLAQLELVLIRTPRVLGDPFSVGRALPPKQVCVARVTRVLTWNGWTEAAGEILVQIDEPHPELAAHQRVRVIGLLQRPSPAMNPGQFNWSDYYREQRVLCSIGIDHAENLRILERPGRSMLTGLREHARRLLGAGFPASASLDHALLRALLLGDHDPELRDVQEQFRRTGTSHHLAISGMHVAVLGAVVHGLCRLARLSPRLSAWTALGFVVIYGLAALPSPPVVRSVLLCAAFTVGLLWRRSVDALQLLAVSVMAMLAYHPLDLFNAGFQLSFGTVLGLILFTKPLTDRLMPPDPDLAVLRSFGHRQTPAARTVFLIRRWMMTAIAASAVAWVVSSPLIAYHFEQLNPWAIPGSVLLAPFVFAALVGGFLKVMLTLLFPPAAGAWASAAALPVEAMRDMVDLLAAFPGADVPLPAPPAWALVLFYALLAAPLLPFARPAVRRGVRLAGPAGAVLLVALPFAGGFRPAPDATQPRPDELSVTLLAVGAGQCAVIAPPRGPLVLVDAGSATLRDPLRKCIAPFVRHLGRWSVGRVILSHSDHDHIGAAAEVVEAYGVREVTVGPHFARLAALNPSAEGLLRFLDARERPVMELIPGNRMHLGGGATLDVLWPPRERVELSSNDSGLVLRLSYAGRTILLPADIQVAAQKALLAGDGAALRADVLVAAHHGSAEDTTRAFIDAVDPAYVLSSNDRTLSLKQSDFEHLLGGRTLLRTHRDGSITVRVTRDGALSVHAFREP